MALQLKGSSCASKACKGVDYKDTTGAYHVTTNPTGWGAPNLSPTTPNFVASLSITNGGSSTSYNITSQIPTSITGDFTVSVPHDLADGISIVTYTVSDGNKLNSYSKTIKIFSYCRIKCCIYKKMLDLLYLDPCKNAGKIEAYLYMWALLESMIDLASGCDVVKAEAVLQRLNKLCDVSNITLKNCGCS